MVNINSLPDLVLRTVFANLDVPDVFQMDRVCPLWVGYQVDLCSQRTKLRLLIGTDDFERGINECQRRLSIPYQDKLLNEVSEHLVDRWKPSTRNGKSTVPLPKNHFL